MRGTETELQSRIYRVLNKFMQLISEKPGCKLLLLDHGFSFVTTTATVRCVWVRAVLPGSWVRVCTFAVHPNLHSAGVFTALPRHCGG